MLKLVNRDGATMAKKEKLTPQKQIETELAKVVNLGNLECAYLFSEEGLLLAGVQGRSDFTQNHALEIAFSIQDALRFFEESPNFHGVHEAVIISRTRQRVSIRSFPAFQQRVSLVLLVPRGKTYRSHSNRLIRIIQNIGQTETR